MCSIAGIISTRPYGRQVLQDMNRCMKHRGPDGEGFYDWNDENNWVHFAHNRLSVIDPTPSSDQPFHYLNRYVLLFNGEIYNYKELRDALRIKGYAFQSTGDTEVIAAAYDAHGTACVDHFDGMFAFAIWDEKEKTLFAARDRFGEKPFYYHYDNSSHTLFFASEIKALKAAGISSGPDHAMIYNYLTLGHVKQVPWPDHTFFNNIYQLPPSHHLLYELGKGSEPVVSRYWDLDKETVLSIPEAQAHEQFMELLYTSVQRRMRSDVSMGTSLSGGLDSSTITAICHTIGGDQYSHRAFSAVFPGFEKDESAYVNEVASRFQLQVHKVTPTAADLAAQLQETIHHQEEPFGSASVFAQYAVFASAKQQGVTVLLDGQGADEILAGYTRYTHWYLQEMIGTDGWNRADEEAGKLRANGFLHAWSWKNRLASVFPAMTAHTLQRKAEKIQRLNAFIHKDYRATYAGHHSIVKPIVEKLNDIQYFDLMVMGLEELLRYADRNAMAHSREVRLPFLSHELVQFVLSLPSHYRIRDGYTKWILRKNMEKQLPDTITWRKGKTGFEPPQKQWLRDPAVQENIFEARDYLINHGICNGSLASAPIIPSGAHDAGNFDFRTWVAAAFLGQ